MLRELERQIKEKGLKMGYINIYNKIGVKRAIKALQKAVEKEEQSKK